MKTNNYYIRSLFIALIATFGVSLFVLAEDAKSGGLTGGYVVDDAVTVPANAYVTFSTLYGGKRYYLGVDTVRAKLGKDTIAVYDIPCYATMWVAGPLWSPDGKKMDNKDYSRWVKSVWLEENCKDTIKEGGIVKELLPHRRYLSVGAGSGTYGILTLRDSSNSVMWHTAKDFTAQSQYMRGWMYYPETSSGIETDRYLTYSPIYGFSRLYEDRPSESQRISVWTRTTGSDLVYNMTPSSIIFEYDVTHNKAEQPIESQVIYYEDVDRFSSHYDQTDIFIRKSTPITNQQKLVDEYGLVGHYEWKSNPMDEEHPESYNGLSKMKCYSIKSYDTSGSEPVPVMGWIDSTMVWARKNGFRLRDDVWYDTIYAIGKSPVTRTRARFMSRPDGAGEPEPLPGTYVNHTDVLYTHFTCAGNDYLDSVNVLRYTYYNDSYTTLTTSPSSSSHIFPYTNELAAVDNPADTAWTFSVSGTYESGHIVRSASNNVVDDEVYERDSLHIFSWPCYRDTIWQVDEDGEYIYDGEGDRIVDHIVLYDTLLVEALNADNTPCEWVVATYLPARNQIRVKIQPYNSGASTNRTAKIRYTYRYWHSSSVGDQRTDSREVWITQKWSGADDAEMYEFHHRGELGADGLQAVHEKKTTLYAIPEEPLNLPLHRDHWGYYRWFNYGGARHDKGVEYGVWGYSVTPKNRQNADFMPINPPADASSRGRWDVMKDVDHHSNPHFVHDHFDVRYGTNIPAINYPISNSLTDTFACDVSAYYNIGTAPTEALGGVGVGEDLTSLTEPTLSYRQIFEVKPAVTRAEQMKEVKGDGSAAKWLETHVVVAPANQPFSLLPQCPIADDGSDAVDEEELQYIYYYNPTGINDANMGIKSASYDDDKAICYSRIGGAIRKTGDPKYRAQLITPSSISVGNSENVVMVNPRKGTGFVIGKGDIFSTIDLPDSVHNGNTTTLQHFIEDEFLNKPDRDAYKLILKRERDGVISIKHGTNYLWFSYDDGLIWDGNNDSWFGYSDWDEDYSAAGDASSYISNAKSSSVRLWMKAYPFIGLIWKKQGYITASAKECTHTSWGSCDRWGDYQRYIHIREDISGWGDNADQAWLFFKIIPPDEVEHYETPRWEKSTDGITWNAADSVAVWNYKTNESICKSGYDMTADAVLHIGENVHTTANETIYYRLRTEHFQLAKFVVVTRDKAKVGPATSAILSEDSIQNHYDIMFTLGNEYFPAPGTGEMTAYNHHLPWSFTELSYHYPRTGEGSIDDDYRVFKTDLPAAGEYAYLNKFSNTSKAMSGAENAYMLCVHAAKKPITVFNFTYPKLPCSDQQIYLTFNLANPVDGTYHPQITAELQGKVGAGDWTPLHRFKTGELAHEGGKWQQFVLEIPQASIAGKDSFRCVATLNGSAVEDAYVLIDRLRFIAKERPMTVFQNKATCLESETEGDVYLTTRMDYNNISDTIKFYAFQYQKKVGDSFVPLQTDAEASPADGDIDVYFNDASGTLTDNKGYSCGVIRIPAKAHMPCNGLTPCSDSIVAISDVASKTKCYVNEGPDAEHAYYVMYLSQRVHANVGDTFRVVMDVIKTASTTPNFTTTGCAEERVIPVDNPIEIHVSGFAGEWKNHPRSELKSATDVPAPDAEHTLRPANATYSVTATINDKFLPSGKLAGSGKCMFDVVRTAEIDRGMTADAWFKERFGISRSQFRELMTFFRNDDDDNWRMRMETNWSNVRPEYFMYDKRYSKEQADSVYAILNRLIVEKGLLQIGVSSYDIYLGDNNNSYAVLWPIPASGTYVDAESSETRAITVCSTPRWFEIHSDSSKYDLRFGYDNLQEGNYYMTPIIRADSTAANNGLKVRIAEITHAEHAGVVIGWDSTYVIDSNDPEWLAGGKSFRYHQDRIVQERIFDNYYRLPRGVEEDIDNHYVTFRPVTSKYIDTLKVNTCPCYDYHANKTTYDTDATTGVLEKIEDSGCNKWGVMPMKEGDVVRGGGLAAHDMPGYQTANNIRLKPGYWYKFRTAFFDVSGTIYHNAGGDGECRGHSEFIVAVAPDTVRWTPSHPDEVNYWNDDNNWTPVMANTPADGFKAKVPMGNTKVIIPQVSEGMLPIVADLVVEQKDTLHYGYAKNTCEQILFKPRSAMLGQERLEYEKAFVDVLLKTDNWQTFSPALKHICSGDMYVPFDTEKYNKANPATGASTDTVEFAPKSFPLGNVGGLSYNPRKYPFAFYQGFYNSTVRVAFNNTDEEDNPIAYTTQSSKNEVDWVKTNLIDTIYRPGHATVINSYDAYDVENREIVVCLPKPDNTYYSYGKNGGSYQAGGSYTMKQENGTARPAFAELEHNLAYDKTALTDAGGAGITYTLRNETESEFFFFGNPTMALVDVYQLCLDNADVLEHTGGTYKFTAYQLIDGTSNSYTVKEITAKGQYFIAPQRAVGLVANSTCKASKTLPVTLKPSALVAITGSGIIVSHEDVKDDAPVRRLGARHEDAQTPKRLYITAANETNRGIKKAHLTLGEQADASRGFVKGEDALSLSSGKHYYNSGAFSTPISLYTIADNEALMLDIRDTLNRVPVVFSTIDAKFDINNYTLLTFSLTGNWDKPLYLYDAVSNDSVLIRNGLQIAIETPLNDQIRYFINGSKRVTSEENQQGTATGIEEVNDQLPNTNYQSGTVVYDVLGRKIMTLNEYDLISNIHLPTGVYIIQRGSNTERMVIR